MSETVKTATRIGKWEPSNGEGAIYRLDPPFKDDYKEHEFVVASAVSLAMFGGGQETMIFPSDGEDVISYGELAVVRTWSHEDALRELGYEVTS